MRSNTFAGPCICFHNVEHHRAKRKGKIVFFY